MLEILPNIKIDYPEYSVITPQTSREYTVRTLNVQEEEKFKASMLTPNQFAIHLNNILWECIVKKPDDIKSLEEFKNKTTLRDREALLYALYHVSYKDVHEFDAYCSACDKSFPVKVDITKCFSMNRYIPTAEDIKVDKIVNEKLEFNPPQAQPGQPQRSNPINQPGTGEANPSPVPTNIGVPQIKVDKPSPVINYDELTVKRVPVQLEIAKNITAFVKQPTLTDEENMVKDPLFQSTKQQAIGTELLVLDRFEIIPDANNPNSREKSIIRQMDNMYMLYQKLPAPDRKQINKAYLDNFSKYAISLKVVSRCTFCGEEAESNIDLVSQFFRALV